MDKKSLTGLAGEIQEGKEGAGKHFSISDSGKKKWGQWGFPIMLWGCQYQLKVRCVVCRGSGQSIFSDGMIFMEPGLSFLCFGYDVLPFDNTTEIAIPIIMQEVFSLTWGISTK